MSKRQAVHFLDTSIFYSKIFPYTKQVNLINQTCTKYNSVTSYYVLMEFQRGVILTLIEFYFSVKDEGNFNDALIAFAQKYQVRPVKVMLMSLNKLISQKNIKQELNRTLFTIKNFIIDVLAEFDNSFRQYVPDNIQCKYSKIQIDKPSLNITDEALQKFYIEYKHFEPVCNFVNFWNTNKAILNRINGHKLLTKKKQNDQLMSLYNILRVDGFNSLAQKCKDCWVLGDTINTLECPTSFILVSVDKFYENICSLLGKQYKIIPSVLSLKNRC